MNNFSRRLTLALIAPVVAVSFSACNPQPDPFHSTIVMAQTGVAGGVTVETRDIAGTIQTIDAAKRKVTLLMEDGSVHTFKVGPDAVNFDQMRVGDRVEVSVTEEVAVYVGAAGAPAVEQVDTTVMLAPKGAKPGGLAVETVEVTAKISAIDTAKRTATLEFPNGQKKTVKVRADIDLSKHQVGESVLIRTTESVILSVGAPKAWQK